MRRSSKLILGIVSSIIFIVVFSFSALAQRNTSVKKSWGEAPMGYSKSSARNKHKRHRHRQQLNIIANDGQGWAYAEVVKTGERKWIYLNTKMKRKHSRRLVLSLRNEDEREMVSRFPSDAPLPIRGSNYATSLNPGGLRGSKRAFRYETLEDGVKAMDELLGRLYFSSDKHNTIDKYVGMYVGPVGKRNIERYKANISTWSGVPRNQVIDVNDRKTRNILLAAALRQESGGDWSAYVEKLFGEGKSVATSVNE